MCDINDTNLLNVVNNPNFFRIIFLQAEDRRKNGILPFFRRIAGIFFRRAPSGRETAPGRVLWKNHREIVRLP
jgi:hypothetical protein